MSVIRNVPTSFDCQNQDHQSCPHKCGGGVNFFGRRAGPYSMLCDCPCHAGCPLFGRSERENPLGSIAALVPEPQITRMPSGKGENSRINDEHWSKRWWLKSKHRISGVERISPGHLRKPSANEDWSSTPTKRICCARQSKSDKCQGRCETFRHLAL